MKLFTLVGKRTGTVLLGFGLLVAVGCTSSKSTEKRSAEPSAATKGSRPSLPPPTTAPATDTPAEAISSVRIGEWLTQAKKMKFDLKEERLQQRFIREFNDGTVIDQVMVAPVQDGPRTKPTFYLVGMGQLKGQFRAMALELEQSSENGGLYLKSTAIRHFAEGSNCILCYFRFNRGKITGAECSETSTGAVERNCEYRTATTNGFGKK